MLINCQFSVGDARPFGRAFPYLLDAPHWPDPLEGQEFQRCFGEVKKRRRGGIEVFEDEAYFANAIRALRFHRLETRRIGEGKQVFHPLGAHRRFFSDGYATSRVEVAIKNYGHRWAFPIHNCNGRDLTRFALDTLDIPVRVMRYRGDPMDCPLGRAGKPLAELYGSATTKTRRPIAQSYISASNPLLICEYSRGEVSDLPEVAQVVEPEAVSGAKLAFFWIDDGPRKVGVWLLERQSTDDRTIRRLRIGLSRLHAEHQTLRWVLHLASARKSKIPSPERRGSFEGYLRRTATLLGLRSRAGFSPAAIADTLRAYDNLLGHEDRILLGKRLERMGEELGAKLADFATPKAQLPADTPIRVFVCYSHKDKDKCQELLTFLQGLDRENLHFWSDRALDPGDEWDEEIRRNLDRAEIAILLVSRYFLNSPYIRDVELQTLLMRGPTRVRLIPIKVGPADIDEVSELSRLQILPLENRNIREHFRDRGKREALFEEIYQKLKKFGAELSDQRRLLRLSAN